MGLSRKEAFRDHKPLLVAEGKHNYFAWVDKEDWLWAHRMKWRTHRWFKGADPVARNREGAYLHREIARRAYGDPPSSEHVCEFLNGDRLDCRRENLVWTHKDRTEYQIKKKREAASV